MVRVNRGNQPAQPFRRPRHHYGGYLIRNVMPERPKKPPTAFNLYIREFYRTPAARNFRTSSDALRHAARVWTANPEVRIPYNNQVQVFRDVFRRDLEKFNRRQKTIKRPGNPYILFARDLWQTEGQGRSFLDFGRYAGEAWRNLSPLERATYQVRSIRATRSHRQMLRRLNLGFEHIDDYSPRLAQPFSAGDQNVVPPTN